jgi:hypothetical protein
LFQWVQGSGFKVQRTGNRQAFEKKDKGERIKDNNLKMGNRRGVLVSDFIDRVGKK